MPPVFEKKEVVGNPNDYRPHVPLDSLLRMIRLSSVIQAPTHLSSPWACRMAEQDGGVQAYLVFTGNCVAYSAGKSDLVRLSAGDVLLVPETIPLVFADSFETPPITLEQLLPSHYKSADTPEHFVARLFGEGTHYGGGGNLTTIITLRMYVDKQFPSTMLGGLPRMIHLPGLISENRTFIESIVASIALHGSQGFIGNSIATRLAEGVLTFCLKTHWERTARRSPGADSGLIDPFIQKVLWAIHENPEADWCIADFAAKAGMSRSAFIKRFNRVVGQTPNDFVTSVRMARATELLQSTETSIARIAADVGYGSEASFSRAFFRWAGLTPGSIRRNRHGNSGASRESSQRSRAAGNPVATTLRS